MTPEPLSSDPEASAQPGLQSRSNAVWSSPCANFVASSLLSSLSRWERVRGEAAAKCPTVHAARPPE